MKAKEKAKELVDVFQFNGDMVDDIRMSEESAIESALICVNEVIDDRSKRGQINFTYWKEVKKEINKL